MFDFFLGNGSEFAGVDLVATSEESAKRLEDVIGGSGGGGIFEGNGGKESGGGKAEVDGEVGVAADLLLVAEDL